MAPAAEAAPTTIKKSMWGPVEVDGQSQFPVYKDLGVGLYQYVVYWDQVAPSRPMSPTNPNDPAYQWPAELDKAVVEANKVGIELSVMLISAPGWANGMREPRWAPNDPQDFADFAEAAARRYTDVRHWLIWGEPTKAGNFQPLTPDNGKPMRGADLEGPRRYAEILDASYVSLNKVRKSNLVIGGNTFTVGSAGVSYTRPLAWIRAVKLPNGRRPRMDLWGHNPFSARVPRLKAPPLGGGLADFSDLDQLAKRLDKAYAKGARKKQRRMKLFLSEYTLPTDHENFEFNFFVSHKTQANWIRKALAITRSYKRIYTFGYLGLYDDPVRPAGDQVERGLLTRSGERKPAYDAYRRG